MRVCDVSPAEAKLVWGSFANPSAAKVAKSFAAAGRYVSCTTVRRWRSNGWREHTIPVSTKGQRARKLLELAGPMLTGDKAVRMTDFVPEITVETPTVMPEIATPQEVADEEAWLAKAADEMKARAAELEKLPHHEIVQISARAFLTMSIIVAEQVTVQAPRLVRNNPEGLALVLRGSAYAQQAGQSGYEAAAVLCERTMKLDAVKEEQRAEVPRSSEPRMLMLTGPGEMVAIDPEDPLAHEFKMFERAIRPSS